MKTNSWKDTLTKDASVEEIGHLFNSIFRHLLRNPFKLIAFPLAIGLLAFLVGIIVYQPKQKAVYIIAAEEETASGFEGLMAQFGLDVGGSNPGGVFKGDNLVRLFQTRSMIERALLNKVDYRNDSIMCADLLFRSTKHARKKEFEGVRFMANRNEHDAITDSALFLTYEYVRDNVLSVSKPDKKMGFIYVNATHRNPDLAVSFSKVMITTVTDFYIESLTMKARKNLDILRFEADSVRTILDRNLKTTAIETDLNVNPMWQLMRVDQNRAMIDLQISISLFGELIKNLKLAEISLRKQTPLIQLIEEPRFPLEKVGYKPWKMGLIGMLAGFLIALYLSFRQFGASPRSEAE
ncbi:MAG: hypothetical protein Q8S18_07180 [Bacteroidales bacterium]|nr:hypothetical protein [Bacteroidales bacterium]